MNNRQFETRMRVGEAFHGLRLPDDNYMVIRVDGHGFSRFTETHFEKPFDQQFHTLMVGTAQTLLEELGGVYAYTESDEISLLLPYDRNLFNRSLEKTVSLSAGAASATFTKLSGKAAHFDSRVWTGCNTEDILDYFRWRQADATRCALNGWCYWTLRNAGRGYAEATAALDGLAQDQKLNLLAGYGINFLDLPLWQRHGSGLYWELYEKTGYDPILRKNVTAMRRRIAVNRFLPVQEEYAVFIDQILADVSARRNTS